ncbi:LPS-assembly protein LptD [Boseongicola aestuarii]|uniref:LPS-assembly protein LptD n=1 Tax=Boseongicola aestuarii TaxID=1470561 RepID=A0A238IUG0_9RHOB|nr:LPS assembly protein LptD [Boseongicola aestuarii]SMX22029.1 LPS-assembly protein LptD precursor [Boseongicola aestuarii]
MKRWFFSLMVCAIFLPAMLHAQALASLVADSVVIDPVGSITAEGNVIIYYDGNRLVADRIVYDRNSDTLSIQGDVTLTSETGDIFTADAATLDSDLRDGVLTSARLVLDQQFQLAAAQISRVEDRYTTLRRVVASSCEVCASNPTPLWEIRASRVIHDTEGQQLYFENAQFRMAGVPLIYLPRLRLPDPTLDRANGLLIPELRTSSDLGTGILLPYFIAIGRHADATLTPYLSARTATLEFSYRQEIRNGQLSFDGAVTNDDDLGGRGYLFANGTYLLPQGFVATGQLEFVSDPGYLFQYDYSSKDRLTNEFALGRVREKDLFRASITEFRTLRDQEIPIRDTLPDRFIETSYQRELDGLHFGGRTSVRVDTAALNRPSSADILGRDVSRIGFGADWSRRDQLQSGLVLDTEAALRIEAYNVSQDSRFERNALRVAPRVATELRWPLARTTADGATEILEPILRFDFANVSGSAVPLEDSRIVEFDEANLFAPSRFPGIDGIEDGPRAALGFNWHRVQKNGWGANLAIGRVASLDGALQFSDTGGQDADQSEWLLAGRLSYGDRLWLSSRSLFDDNVAFTLNETRVDWQGDKAALSSSFLFAQPEPSEGRTDKLSELAFGGFLDLNENWTASTDWRYDFNEGRAARAGLGLEFETDCIRIDLSVTRRYATSTSVTPTTDFGFRVSLLGVGNGQKQGASRSVCRG